MHTHALRMLVGLLMLLIGRAALAQPVSAGTPSPVELLPPDAAVGFDLVVLGELVETGSPARPQLPDRPLPPVSPEFARAIDAARALAPDLVLTTGNLLSAPRSTARWIQQSDALAQAMRELGAPWYPVPGESSIVNAAGDPDAERFDLYAERIGPRWFAFEHHFALIIALDTHDGGPGGISDRQVAWLGETLATSDASQVLVFAHRDLWNEPASAWVSVHAMLAADARPTTVFASSPRCYQQDHASDAVSYYTLGPANGRAPGAQSESFSWPHITLVRVRPDGVRPAIIPTTPSADDPCILPADWQSGDEVDRLRALAAGGWASINGLVGATLGGPLDGTVVVNISNPTDKPLPYSVSCTSSVGASFSPGRVDGTLAPGESLNWNLSVTGGDVGNQRPADHVRASVRYEMSNGVIAPIVQRLPLPIRPVVPATAIVRATDPGLGSALELNGRSAIEADLDLPAALTLECWARADEPRERAAICSTLDLEGQADGAGLFWMLDAEGNPMPTAAVRAAGQTVILRAADPWAWDRWGHLALTHDGQQAALFVNGALVDRQDLPGAIDGSDSTLVIGAAPGAQRPAMFYRGLIDEVRVSEGVRYAAPFTPDPALQPDASTRALYHFDAPDAPIGADASGADAHAWEIGSPRRSARAAP